MTFRGEFKKGVVVFDRPPQLEEGAAVEVMPLPSPTRTATVPPEPPTWAEVFKDFIGKAKGLPSDMARNHDHYIHGARKKE